MNDERRKKLGNISINVANAKVEMRYAMRVLREVLDEELASRNILPAPLLYCPRACRMDDAQRELTLAIEELRSAAEFLDGVVERITKASAKQPAETPTPTED